MSGLKGNFDCIVGIDVSKDKFDACGITGEEVKLFQISVAMDRKGFEETEETSFIFFSVIRINRNGVYGILPCQSFLIPCCCGLQGHFN